MHQARCIRPGIAVAAFAAGFAAMPATAQEVNLARNLAATCAACHGTNGQARGEMKPLAGVAKEKIIAVVAEYKRGARASTVMEQIAKGYSDEQLDLVASYFASQPATK
jgi:cytochrome c553